MNKIKNYFHNTLCEEENFLFFSLIMGFALFCHLFTFFSSNGISENEEHYIYYLFFSIVPLLTYAAYRILDSRKQYLASLLFINGYLALFLIVALVASIFAWNEINPNWIRFYSALQIILTIIAICPDHLNYRNGANKLLVIIFPLALFVFFLSDYQLAIVKMALENPYFQIGLWLGAFCSGLIFIFYWLSTIDHPIVKKTLKVIFTGLLSVTILHIPLFFLEGGHDWNLGYLSQGFTGHHAPYVGPAYSILDGRVPLVDVFSQYGMFVFLPYTLAFIFFTPSFLVAGMVSAVLNIVQNIVLLLILNKTISNKFLVCLGAILTLVLRFTVVPEQQVMTPSMYGGRFLLPLLLILTIIYLPRSKLFNLWTILIAWLCSLWSIENFFLGFAVYSAYATGFCVIHNPDSRKLLYVIPQKLFLVSMLFLSVHLAYSLVVLIIYGSWPRYDIYLEMIASHAQEQVVTWYLPVRPHFFMWGFFASVYFLVFVYSLKIIKLADDNLNQKWAFVKQLLPLTVLGVLELIYYVGKSEDPVLIAPIYPLMGIYFILADRFLFQKPVRNFYSYRVFALIFGLSMVLIIAFSTMKINSLMNSPNLFIVQRIASVYSCITTTKNCQDLYGSLKGTVQKVVCGPSVSEELSASDIETYNTIVKWQQFERKIIFLQDGSHTEQILMLAKKFHKLPISSSQNDEMSPTLLKKIAKSAATLIKEDDILILQQRSIHENPKLSMVSPIFDTIKQKWKLCLLDQTSTVKVYRITNPSLSCKE